MRWCKITGMGESVHGKLCGSQNSHDANETSPSLCGKWSPSCWNHYVQNGRFLARQNLLASFRNGVIIFSLYSTWFTETGFHNRPQQCKGPICCLQTLHTVLFHADHAGVTPQYVGPFKTKITGRLTIGKYIQVNMAFISKPCLLGTLDHRTPLLTQYRIPACLSAFLNRSAVQGAYLMGRGDERDRIRCV